MRVLPVALVGLLAALAPMAQAQEHDHADATGVVIAHDVPPTGRTYVGNLNHFAILDLGLETDGKTADVVPDFHQQNHARVTWNGLVLYETTPDSGHDYDGIHGFDVAFPGPGTYTVEAISEEGTVQARFNGTVVAPKSGSGAVLTLDGPTSASAGDFVAYTFRTSAPDGTLVKHADAYFEVRQGTQVVFRTKTHTHDEDQSVWYAFPAPGTYTVRVIDFLSYPSGKETNDFAPSVVEKTVTVGPGPMAVNDGSRGPAFLPPTDQNAITMGTTSGGDLLFIGTYDPYTQVGPSTLQHLTALVMDPATKAPVQHVDFKATFAGPQGILFQSDTLHEYDGLFEFAAAQAVPGIYSLELDAEYDAWKGHLEMAYVVAPPVVPVALDVPPMPAAFAGIYTVVGLEGAASGRPLGLTIAARGLTGQPVPHGEIDVQLLDAAGVPVLMTKLHTHSDGDFPFTLTLPEPGDYTLRLTPFPLDPQASATSYGGTLGGSLDFPVHAIAGDPLPMAPASTDPAKESPAPAGLLLLVALGAAVALARRR